jgi:molybdopterin molybdotransferase
MTTSTWTDARQAARDAAKPLDAVDVALADALGSALAEPIRAHTAVPSFDTSAMDGFAVCGVAPWSLVGHVRAGGRPHNAVLRPGHAVEISTGAPVPPGADAVLPVERAIRVGVTIVGEVRVGQHVRRAGEDCARGHELLPDGTVVSPAVLGLAAAAGYDVLRVHRSPRVAVVITGDELVLSGSPEVGRVRDAIGPVLPGVLADAGADLVSVTHVPDHVGALLAAVSRDDVEVLVVGGATSVGPADHLRAVLRSLHADVRVSGVACRPGHPQLLAVLPDGRCVVGLPGNPFAALGACLTLLEPLLGAFSGRGVRPAVTARLVGDVAPHPCDTKLVPVLRSGSTASPVGHDRPGTLWGAALADAVAVVPPAWAGGEVELLRLPA